MLLPLLHRASPSPSHSMDSNCILTFPGHSGVCASVSSRSLCLKVLCVFSLDDRSIIIGLALFARCSDSVGVLAAGWLIGENVRTSFIMARETSSQIQCGAWARWRRSSVALNDD